MPRPNDLSLRLRIANEQAVQSFREAHLKVQQLAEDYPWIADLQDVDSLLQQAGEGLEVTRDDGSPGVPERG